MGLGFLNWEMGGVAKQWGVGGCEQMRRAAVMSETDHALYTGCLFLSPVNQMQWLVSVYYSILFMRLPSENVCYGSNVFHPLQAFPSRPPMPCPQQQARHLTKAALRLSASGCA